MNPFSEPIARASLAVRGTVVVRKYGRDRERLPVRVDHSRRAFQRVWEHHQHNLITNAGMDYAVGNNASGFAWPQLAQWIAVGTSSAAPAVTDTALGSEIARSNATLSLGTAGLGSHPSTGVQEYVRTRAFDFGEANGNLTEFGGFIASTGGNALVRELFRDELGDPTVITKTSDEQLAVIHTVSLAFAPTSMTAGDPITVTGYGAFDASHMFYQAFRGSTYFIGDQSGLGLVPVASLGDTYAVDSPATFPTNISVGGSNPPTGSAFVAYTGGTFYRDVTSDYTGTPADENVVGWAFARASTVLAARYVVCGWRFDDPSVLVKGKDYRLRATARFQFARA